MWGGGSESEAVGGDKEMKVRMRKVGKSRMRTRRGINKVEMVTGREVMEAAATPRKTTPQSFHPHHFVSCHESLKQWDGKHPSCRGAPATTTQPLNASCSRWFSKLFCFKGNMI